MAEPYDSDDYAFARACSVTGEYSNGAQRGLTIRDYFAAKAMQASIDMHVSRCDDVVLDGVAKDSYRMADAMLRARAK